MAKKKKMVTEIIIVLDRSGSMGSIRLDTIEGFNKFIEDPKCKEINICITHFVHS